MATAADRPTFSQVVQRLEQAECVQDLLLLTHHADGADAACSSSDIDADTDLGGVGVGVGNGIGIGIGIGTGRRDADVDTGSDNYASMVSGRSPGISDEASVLLSYHQHLDTERDRDRGGDDGGGSRGGGGDSMVCIVAESSDSRQPRFERSGWSTSDYKAGAGARTGASHVHGHEEEGYRESSTEL